MRLVPILAALILCAAAITLRQVPAQNNDIVARGRYLVELAGKCSDCHGAKLHGPHSTFSILSSHPSFSARRRWSDHAQEPGTIAPGVLAMLALPFAVAAMVLGIGDYAP